MLKLLLFGLIKDLILKEGKKYVEKTDNSADDVVFEHLGNVLDLVELKMEKK